MAARQSPGKMAIWGLLRPVTVQSPAGDRQVIADPVIRAVQGHQNRAASYRCANLKIRQKSCGRRILVQLGRRLKHTVHKDRLTLVVKQCAADIYAMK